MSEPPANIIIEDQREAIEQLVHERDEALAKVERLSEKLDYPHEEIADLWRERDEARAQVQTLREALREIYTESLLNRPEDGPLGRSPKATIRILGRVAREALAGLEEA